MIVPLQSKLKKTMHRLDGKIRETARKLLTNDEYEKFIEIVNLYPTQKKLAQDWGVAEKLISNIKENKGAGYSNVQIIREKLKSFVINN